MSLFSKAVSVKRNVKALIYGPSGAGKTWFGLASRNALEGKEVVYLGNEQGASFYADIPELKGFYLLETRDLSKVDAAISELERGNHNFGCIVVDTLTDLYRQRQRKYTRYSERTKEEEIPLNAWGKIKREHDNLVRRLINLPMHVVVIGQEKPIYDKRGKELVQVGVTVDADKKDTYMFDLVGYLHWSGNTRSMRVEKDRTNKVKTGSTLKNPEFKKWATGVVSETVKVDEEITPQALRKKLESALGCKARKDLLEKYKTFIADLDGETSKSLLLIETEAKSAKSKLFGMCADLKEAIGPGFVSEIMGAITRATEIPFTEDCDALELASEHFPAIQAYVSMLSLIQLRAAIHALGECLATLTAEPAQF